MAPLIWKSTVFIVVALAVVDLLFDLGLIAARMESISDWLRANPGWFYIPMLLMVIGLFVLQIHLFYFPLWRPRR